MATSKELRIGLVGYGFMGRTHSNGYKRVNDFFPDLATRPVLKAVCGRSEDKAKEFAGQWQYESVETDWKALIARDDIDAIDICTPNDTHAPIAIAAAEAGKMVLCEKPIAVTRKSRSRWSRPSRRPASPTRSGTTTAAHPQSPLPRS